MVSEEDGSITYQVVPGIFRQMVARAVRDPEHSYALFIDEINRANISKVFGELITLIEAGKRMCWDPDSQSWEGGIRVKLPYTHSQNPGAEPFGVPNNLHLIGTMNTADRSIALLDTALRRRFVFEELLPDSSVIGQVGKAQIEAGEGLTVDLVQLLDAMNNRIEFLFDRDHRIGHSYFLNIEDYAQLERVFLDRIIPLLQEYFYGDWQKIQMVFADLEDSPDTDGLPRTKDTAIISCSIETPKKLFRVADDTLPPKRIYEIPESIPPESLIKVYED